MNNKPLSVEQVKKIHQLENMALSLDKGICAGDIPDETVKKAQSVLNVAAKILIDDDNSIGSRAYIVYENQALLHWIKGNEDEAKDFAKIAAETKGDNNLLTGSACDLLSTTDMTKEHIANSSNDIIFFDISFTKLYLLSVATFGIYELYWFYKNWNAIRIAESKKMWPFWRAMYSIFFAGKLFKTVLNHAQKKGYENSYSAGWLYAIYIILLCIGNGIGRYNTSLTSNTYDSGTVAFIAITIVLLEPLIFLPVQKAIIYNNKHIKTKRAARKTTAGEIFVVIVGLLLGALSLYGYSIPDTATTDSTVISTEAQNEKTKYEALEIEYKECSDDINARDSTVDLTSEYEVNRYNEDLQACKDVYTDLSASIEKYNTLIGQ